MTLAVKVTLNSNPTNQPNDKILDWSKLKAFTDDEINVSEKLKFVFGRVGNIVGKEENAGYYHFLLFPQCFRRLLSQGRKKLGLCGKELTLYKMTRF